MTTPHPAKRPAFEPPARLLRPIGYDPEMKRPPSRLAGTALVLLGVVAGVAVLAGIVAEWEGIVADVVDGFAGSAQQSQFALWFVVGATTTVLLFETLLAVLIFRGHNWARVVVMLFSVFAISGSFIAWAVEGQAIRINGALLSVAVDILLLLALSSRSAAAYARRFEHPDAH